MAWDSLVTTLQMPVLILGRLPEKSEAGVCTAMGNLLSLLATSSCSTLLASQ